VTHHPLPSIRQHATHEDLVDKVESPSVSLCPPTLDAIIVPASRSAGNLEDAVGLAQAASCRLVVLCSRQARSDDVNDLLASHSFADGVAVDLPAGYQHRWLEFATSRPKKIGRLPEACADRDSDLSIKRNLGLIIARMLGWDRVFFMDDDIRDVSLDDLQRTVSILGPKYYSVGMRVADFPDNSVVCHAHRATRKFQDILVSGSALAVDCSAPIGFFPDVYNEDWLFFYDYVAEHRLAWSSRHATQLAYDPFDDPQRAARQEFGDVLAEGLYALLHRGQGTKYATQDYWVNFLDARRGFLDAIVARADRADSDVRQKMLNSVRAARQCTEEIEPEYCEHYVRLWRRDRERWEQDLKALPRVSSVAKALVELGLAPTAVNARGDRDDRGPASTVLSEEVVTVTSDVVRDGTVDLAGLNALANTHCMERLQETIQRQKLAVGKVVRVGMLVVLAGALVGSVILRPEPSWAADHAGSTAMGRVSRLRRVLLRRGRGSPVSRQEPTRAARARSTASPSMRAITWPTQLCTPMP
jgi:hypothetical protein